MTVGKLTVRRLCAAALALLAVAACSPSDVATTPTQASIADTPSARSTSGPRQPVSALTLSAAEFQGITHAGIAAAVEDLSGRIDGDLVRAQITRAEEVTWRDASLGCPVPDKFYAQVQTPGIWLILSNVADRHRPSLQVLSNRGQDYDYRIAESQTLLCTQDQTIEPSEREPIEGLWTRLASMRTARSEVAAAELNGKIYVLGGFGRGATANEEYDPVANRWRSRAPIPRGVDHAAAVALEGLIYLIGGFDGRFRAVDTVLAYDPSTDSWTAKAELPTPRGALGAVAVNGKIYAIGGRASGGDVGTTEEYNPATDTWHSRSPMPTPRDHIAIAVVDDRVYIIGGRLGTFARNLDATEEYDPKTDTWTKKAPIPVSRSGIAAAAVGGRIYVFGGESDRGTFHENERYDPNADSWTNAEPLPTARHGLGAVAIGNRIYVLAGGPTPGGSQSALNEVFIVLADRP